MRLRINEEALKYFQKQLKLNMYRFVAIGSAVAFLQGCAPKKNVPITDDTSEIVSDVDLNEEIDIPTDELENDKDEFIPTPTVEPEIVVEPTEEPKVEDNDLKEEVSIDPTVIPTPSPTPMPSPKPTPEPTAAPKQNEHEKSTNNQKSSGDKKTTDTQKSSGDKKSTDTQKSSGDKKTTDTQKSSGDKKTTDNQKPTKEENKKSDEKSEPKVSPTPTPIDDSKSKGDESNESSVIEGALTVKQLQDKISSLQKKYKKMNKDEIKALVVGANIDYISDEVLMEILGAKTKSDLKKWAEKLENAIYNKTGLAIDWHFTTLESAICDDPYIPELKYNEMVKLDELFFDKSIIKHCRFIENLVEIIALDTFVDYEQTQAAKITLIGHYYDYESFNYGGYIDGFVYKHDDPALGSANYVINYYYVYFTGHAFVKNTSGYAPVKNPESYMRDDIENNYMDPDSNPIGLRAEKINVKKR